MAQSLQHVGVGVGGRVLEQIAEVRVRVDAVRAHERGGAAEQRLFGGVAADGCEQRELLQRLRKGSAAVVARVIGENPR